MFMKFYVIRLNSSFSLMIYIYIWILELHIMHSLNTHMFAEN